MYHGEAIAADGLQVQSVSDISQPRISLQIFLVSSRTKRCRVDAKHKT